MIDETIRIDGSGTFSSGSVTMRGNQDPNALARVDKYILLETLGSGSFGVVYRARDTFSPAEYALKLIPALRTADERTLRDFREEKFPLVQQLHHQHIADVMELHRVETIDAFPRGLEKGIALRKGDYLVVMRFAPGRTLKEELVRSRCLAVSDVMEIGRQIADALDYAHQKGVVHRDVKPSNVSVSRDKSTGRWEVLMLDFGLAADIRDSSNRQDAGAEGPVGSLPYMSPEQLGGEAKRIDGRADEYALAAMMYQMLSGSYPFRDRIEGAIRDKNVDAVRKVVESEAIPDLPGLGEVQNLALHRALSKSPNDRFPTCAAFLQAFEGTIPVRANPAEPYPGYPPGGSYAPPPARPDPRRVATTPSGEILTGDALAAAQAWMWLKRVPGKLLRRSRNGILRAADLMSGSNPKLRVALERRGLLPSKTGAEEDPEPPSLGGFVEAPSFASMAKPKTTPVDLGGGVTFEMAGLFAGEFRMGSPHSEAGRQPGESLHIVRISAPFHLSVAPVTQLKWRLVMGALPPQAVEGDDLPVTGVSWDDCRAFLEKLNETNGRPGYVWRLPTEAQWEYACRAGSYARFAGTGRIEDMAWYSGNSGGRIHPVRQKQPNAWGIYDMHGNVWEWCEDGWAPSLGNERRSDPCADRSGPFRVARGGSWNHAPGFCRSASRMKMAKVSKFDCLGFRVALVPS